MRCFTKVRLLLIISFIVHNISGADVFIGVKCGANLSTFHGAEDSYMGSSEVATAAEKSQYKNHQFRPGFTTGITTEVALNQYIGFQAELLYSVKGYRVKRDTKEVSRNIHEQEVREFEFKNVELPVLFMFTVPSDFLSPSMYGGTALSYCFDASSNKQKIKTPYQKFDVGATVGVLFNVSHKSNVFAFDLRYTHGLIRVKKETDEVGVYSNNAIFDKDERHSVISLTLGYEFKVSPDVD